MEYPPDTIKRLRAADKLLNTSTTTRQKFNHLRTIIKGINPQVDESLSKASKAFKKLDQIHKKKVIPLTASALPEKTREQKKRKKALLLFLRYWGQLKREVKRINKEINRNKPDQTQPSQSVGKASRIAHFAQASARLARFAKGPLGIVAIAAAGIVAIATILSAKSVTINLTNDGCSTITPSVPRSINLPGLKVSTDPIPSGASSQIIMPPLSANVNGTTPGSLTITFLGQSMQFRHPSSNADVIFNGQSLIGTSTRINLSSQKTHQLTLSCKQMIPATPPTHRISPAR